jgi:hypothetical protein
MKQDAKFGMSWKIKALPNVKAAAPNGPLAMPHHAKNAGYLKIPKESSSMTLAAANPATLRKIM